MWAEAHNGLRIVSSAIHRKAWDTQTFLSQFGEYLHMQGRGIKNGFQFSGFRRRLHG